MDVVYSYNNLALVVSMYKGWHVQILSEVPYKGKNVEVITYEPLRWILILDDCWCHCRCWGLMRRNQISITWQLCLLQTPHSTHHTNSLMVGLLRRYLVAVGAVLTRYLHLCDTIFFPLVLCLLEFGKTIL